MEYVKQQAAKSRFSFSDAFESRSSLVGSAPALRALKQVEAAKKGGDAEGDALPLYAWGTFDEAEDVEQTKPAAVKLVLDAKVTVHGVACGHKHVVVVTSDGACISWGLNAGTPPAQLYFDLRQRASSGRGMSRRGWSQRSCSASPMCASIAWRRGGRTRWR
jgi:hypothetical protein